MSISPINSAVQALQQVAAQAAGQQSVSQAAVASGGFADELQASIRRVSQLQQTAEASSNAFLRGDPDVALNDVMVDKEKAGIAFQMTVQVRNKLVSSYKEIMNMPV